MEGLQFSSLSRSPWVVYQNNLSVREWFASFLPWEENSNILKGGKKTQQTTAALI